MPEIPNVYGLTIFAVLFVLLIQKEILRALGRSGSTRWTWASNAVIGVLFVVYTFILFSRFITFVQ